MDWKDSRRGILPAGRLRNTIWCGGEDGGGKVGTTQELLGAATWSVVLALGGCVRTARAILGLGSMSVNRIEWCTSGAGWCTEPNRVS